MCHGCISRAVDGYFTRYEHGRHGRGTQSWNLPFQALDPNPLQP